MNTFCKVEKELLLFDYYNDISEGNYYISKDALAVMVCIGINSHGNETMFISYNYLEYLMFKEYKRYDMQLIKETEVDKLPIQREKEILMIYTCYPFNNVGYATQRYVVYAELEK